MKKIYKILFLLFIIALALNMPGSIRAQNSSDAIAIRIMPNPDHLSALRWYQKQGFNGSPQSITVDGYEAVRDGRTVYANVANVTSGVSSNNLYTNIYLISYNQQAEKSTSDIFSQILSHWKFNSNMPISGHCRKSTSTACLMDDDCEMNDFCDSYKARIIRDVQRLSDLSFIKGALSDFHKRGYYPKLDSGTYIPHRAISVWPSWENALGKELKINLPVDPVNKIGNCSGFNAITCWNEQTKRFATNLPDLPGNSLLYSYEANSGNVCATFESGMNLGANVCSIPACLNFDNDNFGLPASNECVDSRKDCDDNDSNVGAGTNEVCSGSLDEDCDGFIDCNDADCNGNALCINVSSCGINGCESGEDCNSCPVDCGTCPPTCGDNLCDTTCNECNECQIDCFCGNNVICSQTEQCDDGNTINGDGCSSTCQSEASTCADNDFDGYDTCAPGMFGDDGNIVDCNDAQLNISPGHSEICDGIDNDCDANIDEGLNPDSCQFSCQAGGWTWVTLGGPHCCGNDANEGPYEASETASTCNDGRDNDCDGYLDNNDSDCSGSCLNISENDHINALTLNQCNQCDVVGNTASNGDQDGEQIEVGDPDWLNPLGIADRCDSDCGVVGTTVTRLLYRLAEDTAALCSNGIDDNCNGQYDCDDSNCQSTSACCQDDCISGTIGCTGTDTRWICGNYDTDACLELQFEPCQGSSLCTGGSCITACTNADGDMYSVEGTLGLSCCGANNNLPCNVGSDCDDTRSYVSPGSSETCDGFDNNCNGQTDEGCDDDQDRYCDMSMQLYNGSSMCTNTIFTGNGMYGNDCDDNSIGIHPGASEICDGINNDCSDATADGSSQTAQLNNLQAGVCAGSYQTCNGASGWQDDYSSLQLYEDPETSCSDGEDNNCDGTIDNCGVLNCIFPFVFPCNF